MKATILKTIKSHYQSRFNCRVINGIVHDQYYDPQKDRNVWIIGQSAMPKRRRKK